LRPCPGWAGLLEALAGAGAPSDGLPRS